MQDSAGTTTPHHTTGGAEGNSAKTAGLRGYQPLGGGGGGGVGTAEPGSYIYIYIYTHTHTGDETLNGWQTNGPKTDYCLT